MHVFNLVLYYEKNKYINPTSSFLGVKSKVRNYLAFQILYAGSRSFHYVIFPWRQIPHFPLDWSIVNIITYIIRTATRNFIQFYFTKTLNI